ncbi:hypothetical protein LWF15_33360 [Kineosporia rhizophila]|uniref:hypothetical protein n=1 Tax=Kineosporia rhizophila TaxID=84633 RepID=UPI001E3BF071|nr:hypothetical protein [Kineosporia rhizophila]MCE0540393.1 hypothetical protein [Kineosporia rhizophila]
MNRLHPRPAAVLSAALVGAALLTACSTQASSLRPADTRPSAPSAAATSSQHQVGHTAPAPNPRAACSALAQALLGGNPSAEGQEAAYARASIYATTDYAHALRTMPPTEGHAESTWNEWAEAGVTSIAVNTAVLGGLDAPPKDSPWAMLTATQTPHTDRGRSLKAQQWQVTCITDRAPERAGWLVTSATLTWQTTADVTAA